MKKKMKKQLGKLDFLIEHHEACSNASLNRLTALVQELDDIKIELQRQLYAAQKKSETPSPKASVKAIENSEKTEPFKVGDRVIFNSQLHSVCLNPPSDLERKKLWIRKVEFSKDKNTKTFHLNTTTPIFGVLPEMVRRAKPENELTPEEDGFALGAVVVFKNKNYWILGRSGDDNILISPHLDKSSTKDRLWINKSALMTQQDFGYKLG